jgi:hypothetical protein
MLQNHDMNMTYHTKWTPITVWDIRFVREVVVSLGGEGRWLGLLTDGSKEVDHCSCSIS